MQKRLFGTLLGLLLLSAAAFGCGGGEPEAEATWETHTTLEDGTSGGEDDAPPPEPRPEPEPLE